MGSCSLKKDLHRIIEEIQRQGWRVRLGKKHFMAYPADPSQPPIGLPTTPSDRRALANIVADLRRRGAIL